MIADVIASSSPSLSISLFHPAMLPCALLDLTPQRGDLLMVYPTDTFMPPLLGVVETDAVRGYVWFNGMARRISSLMRRHIVVGHIALARSEQKERALRQTVYTGRDEIALDALAQRLWNAIDRIPIDEIDTVRRETARRFAQTRREEQR